jgi:hypothetical protein
MANLVVLFAINSFYISYIEWSLTGQVPSDFCQGPSIPPSPVSANMPLERRELPAVTVSGPDAREESNSLPQRLKTGFPSRFSILVLGLVRHHEDRDKELRPIHSMMLTIVAASPLPLAHSRGVRHFGSRIDEGITTESSLASRFAEDDKTAPTFASAE